MKALVSQDDATKGSDTANTVNHTPGHWIAFPSNVVRDKYGVEIAAVSYKSHPQECEANARLIAAAPELLEALTGCLAYIEAKLAIDGKSLTADEWNREIQHVQQYVSEVSVGRYVGDAIRADLSAARAAIAKATNA